MPPLIIAVKIMSKIFVPKNKLKEKVGEGGFKEESIQRAQKSIEENVVDFNPIATEYLKNIRTALADYQNKQNSPRLYSDLLDQLTQLRAQGSMFHYSSITAITDIVVDLLDSLNTVDEKIIEIVNSYEQCATIILKNGIKDDTDKTCQTVASELKAVCNKYKAKHNAK